jgi:hypothetical protein
MPRPFRLTRPEPPEHAIQDAVLRFLRLDARVAWAHRFNTGAVQIPRIDSQGRHRGHRFVRFAFPGCSDILGQLVTGHLLAVEVKRPSTKPTADQAAFLATVRDHGGLAVVARSVEDAQQALDAFFAAAYTPGAGPGSRAVRTERAQTGGGAAGQEARPALRLERAS